MCPHTPNERRCGAIGAESRLSSRRFKPTAGLPRMVALWMSMALLLSMATAAGAEDAAPDPGICTTGEVEAAAATLFGPSVEVVDTEVIAGFKTVLVLEPRIYPGTRRRMIAAGGQWCEASAGFNHAWRLGGRDMGAGRAMAEGYAQLAATPYFDGVTLSAIGAEVGVIGTWVVETHARTNGVEARWSITTDGDGISSATWTATGFARRPFEASWEGLTALPGATETYTRLPGGALAEERGLPTPESAHAISEDGPGLLQHTFEDGYTIVTSIGDAHVGLDPGTDTGISKVDILRATMRAARENYEEFRAWGFEKGWRALPGFSDEVGYVYVNNALGLACLACVFISDHFQIHLNSEVQTALDLLGYDGYRDRDQAYSLIIGHEMFHNFQNRYNRPGHFNQAGRGTPTSYSEGTARFQETLHDYAETTFAPRTLVTANDANGCNGFDTGGSMDAGMAAGPFGKTYNTCFFWGPWYVANGQEAFLDLIREAMPAHSPETNSYLEVSRAAEQAAGKPFADQLAEFAGSSITGRGRSWATWFGTEPLDWDSLFERWTPTALEHGRSARTLGPGGLMAHELTQAAEVSVSGSEHARLYILRHRGDRLTIRPAEDGQSAAVGAVKRDERVYAVVARPAAGSETVALNVEARGKLPPPEPAQAPVTGSVITLAAGAGVRVGGVTSHYIGFEVPEGVDNFRAEIVATYPLPGDIDLFLQRRSPDGTWATLGSGTSASLSGESLSVGRLEVGTYRIEVHNWAGPPGNEVSVTATFYNSVGEPGV